MTDMKQQKGTMQIVSFFVGRACCHIWTPSRITVLWQLRIYERKYDEKKESFPFGKDPLSSWCGRRDLNSYGLPHAPQTCASAYSATAAFALSMNNYNEHFRMCQALFSRFPIILFRVPKHLINICINPLCSFCGIMKRTDYTEINIQEEFSNETDYAWQRSSCPRSI